ncbi:MAG: glycosyltransferase family 4 protein [Wujia sp.]
MRILYLCTFYHRALLFRQQMDALTERGHYVRAFSSAKYGEGIADKFKPIMDDMVVHRECWNKLDRILFFPRQWKIEKQLQKAYDLREFDMLHAQLLLSSGYSALRMKKKYNLPYVVSVRSTDLNGFIRLPYFRRMARNIVKEANGVLFLSNAHKAEFLNRFIPAQDRDTVERKCTVIGNCLERFWEEHTAGPRRGLRDENALRILLVAKIRPVKNIPVAAQAVEILGRRGYNATLTVVGEVQDEEELEKIRQFSCVEVLPFMKKEELIDVYGTHDIFLLPSKNETFGRVYVEAMTQGLPVLYTSGQGFDQAFPEGTVGYSVPSDSPDIIADRIEMIIKDYKKISENCIKNSSLYYEDHIMGQLEQFYLSHSKKID